VAMTERPSDQKPDLAPLVTGRLSRPIAATSLRGKIAMFLTALVVCSAVAIQIGSALLPAQQSLFGKVGPLRPESQLAADRADAADLPDVEDQTTQSR
jgi:hypothetical protein